MRVGLLIYGSIDTVSGGYLYDRRLVSALEKAGDTVEIISLPWRSYLFHLTDNFSASLVSRIDELCLDVLVQDELNHPSLFLLNRVLKARTGVPLVGLVHHLRISEAHPRLLMPLYRAVETRFLRSVDAFIYNSQTTKSVVEALVPGHPPSVVATPAGDRLNLDVSLAHIRSRAEETGPLRLLFLGSLIPRKGFHTLLDALARLAPGSWTLEVAGSRTAHAGYARRMQRRVSEMGWSDRVLFYGALPDDRLKSVLLHSQVLVLPSQYEGFGIAYLEGMNAGLPAIGSTGGAAPEIIRDGENGFLIPPGNSGQLAGRLEGLHTDRRMLAEMGARARELFDAHPSWDESMGKVRDFLKTLAR